MKKFSYLLSLVLFLQVGIVFADERKTNIAMQTVGKLYQEKCMACHGVHGDGKGMLAIALDPKPRDFTSYSEMRELIGNQEAIEESIAKGKSDTAMPAWADSKLEGDPLSKSQIKVLAWYVQSFMAEEQFLLQLCTDHSFTFDTHLDSNYEIIQHNSKLTAIQFQKNNSNLIISAQDPSQLSIHQALRHKKAIRSYFVIKQEDKTPILMTVRFKFPCSKYLKDQGGYKLKQLF